MLTATTHRQRKKIDDSTDWRAECNVVEMVPHGFEVRHGKYLLISAPVTYGWTQNPLAVATHFGTRQHAEQTLATASPPPGAI
jgi:hypothetical protein